MKEKERLRRWLCCSALYAAVCILCEIVTGLQFVLGQAWNILLAVLPLVFACALPACHAKWGKGVLAALWLLFLPNTFYMMTDIVHVPKTMEWPDTTPGALPGSMHYAHDAKDWLLLLVLGTGAVLGMMLGFESMRICRQALCRGLPRAVQNVCGGIVMLLCGFGVYIGRFLRLNSWDILNPFGLVKKILLQLDVFSVQMTLEYTGMIALLWLAYRALRTECSENE